MAQASAEETIDREQLHELAQQLRVDSVRAAAAAGSGHPTSSMSAADLMAVLLTPLPALRLLRPREQGERPPRLLQGPRLAAALRHVQDGRGDRRRGAAHLPRVRLAPAGPPDAGDPLGRRRDGLARPGPADLDRDRARRQAARSGRLPGLGALRRLRARRGLDVGGLRARRPRRARQHDRDRRRQPARPARPDDARVGHRVLGGARCRPAAGTCRRSTATTSRRSTRLTCGRSRRTVPRRSSPAPRRAPASPRSRTSPNQHGKPLADPEAAVAELGGERSLRIEVQSPPETRPLRDQAVAGREADLRGRREGRHPRRLR